MVQDVEHRTRRPGLGIVRGEDQPVNARMDHRARAHRARLERRNQRASREPVVADGVRRGPKRDHFRMRRGIVVAQHAVLPPGNDPAIEQNRSADRNLVRPLCGARLAERLLHEFKIRHAYTAGCCWVMQCSAPSPQMKSTQWMPTMRWRGNSSASVFSAWRSFASLKVGTRTNPFAM